MLAKNNKCTKWSEGLRFVQWQKNIRHHSGIGRSLYEAFYDQKPQLRNSAWNLSEEIKAKILTEEDLEEALGSTSAEEADIQNPFNELQCEGDCFDDCALCSRQLNIDSQRNASNNFRNIKQKK